MLRALAEARPDGKYIGFGPPPASVTATVTRVMTLGLPVMLAGSREVAASFVESFLWLVAKRRWTECRDLSIAMSSMTTAATCMA